MTLNTDKEQPEQAQKMSQHRLNHPVRLWLPHDAKRHIQLCPIEYILIREGALSPSVLAREIAGEREI